MLFASTNQKIRIKNLVSSTSHEGVLDLLLCILSMRNPEFVSDFELPTLEAVILSALG